MTKLTERAIRAMPYEIRIQHYNREKDELLRKMTHIPAAELQSRLEELVKKWKV